MAANLPWQQVITINGYLSPFKVEEQVLSKFPENLERVLLVDMRNVNHVRPFSTLILANQIRRLVFAGHTIFIAPPKFPNVRAYLARMNFFKFANVSFHGTEDDLDARHRFRAISEFEGQVIDWVDGKDPLEDLNLMIEDLGAGDEFTKAIMAVMSELCDNAARHSKSTLLPSIFVQRFGSTLEMAIVDTGIGIKQTYIDQLTEGVDVGLPDADIIMKYATKGHTSNPNTGKGMGLRKTRLLVEKNRGDLVIYSKSGYYLNRRGNETIRSVAPWHGTAIGIRLKSTNPVYMNQLTVIKKEELDLVSRLNLGF